MLFIVGSLQADTVNTRRCMLPLGNPQDVFCLDLELRKAVLGILENPQKGLLLLSIIKKCCQDKQEQFCWEKNSKGLHELCLSLTMATTVCFL